jgi:hypothetical protein
MKRALFVLVILMFGVAAAQASDHCRRNTTRYYYGNNSSNCRQNYGPQPAYFTEYMQNRYVTPRPYYTEYVQQRNCSSSSSSCLVPTTTVCSPVVSYSYRPAPRVVYYERVCRSRNRGLTITIELR